ncbi:hypothetical protein QBC35DRAFT_177558 [Podospora australis]|uniref:Uncharacterized protein n=1 Tax=Podospora australis TaxID=1536484 RepID=A0AAN6WX99_9PEZI|nr:hypothetical protein QBC35DRAFT_177558 [Podospora australis]
MNFMAKKISAQGNQESSPRNHTTQQELGTGVMTRFIKSRWKREGCRVRGPWVMQCRASSDNHSKPLPLPPNQQPQKHQAATPVRETPPFSCLFFSSDRFDIPKRKYREGRWRWCGQYPYISSDNLSPRTSSLQTSISSHKRSSFFFFPNVTNPHESARWSSSRMRRRGRLGTIFSVAMEIQEIYQLTMGRRKVVSVLFFDAEGAGEVVPYVCSCRSACCDLVFPPSPPFGGLPVSPCLLSCLAATQRGGKGYRGVPWASWDRKQKPVRLSVQVLLHFRGR